MPRAFLITNKRYKSAVDHEDQQISRETSPERTVCTAEGPWHKSEDCDSEQSLYVDDLKPTSPHSPAHESRGPEEEGSQGALSAFRVLDYCQAPYQSSTTALVSVIRQLMQQPSRSTTPMSSSSDLGSPGYLMSNGSQQDTHVCTECGKRYSTSSNLARHRQTHRSVTDKKARKCPHCDKVYVSMPAYSMHVRTHSQGCQCPYCGKCFSRPWLLQGHIRTHTGEKPFTCPVCRKAFADKSNLRAHIQTHSSSKPYVCQRCGKAFALKSYLYKHEESSCMRVHRQMDKMPKDGDLEVHQTVLNLIKEEERKVIVVG